MKRLRIPDEKSAQFVRAYEAAVVETIVNALRTRPGMSVPGPLK
jgi:hypothetical protein